MLNYISTKIGWGIKPQVVLIVGSLVFCVSSLEAGNAEKRINEKKALGLKIEAEHVSRELSIISPSLEEKLNLTPKQKNYVKDSDKLNVTISLNVDDVNVPMPISSFSVHIDSSGDEKIYVDTKEVGKDYVEKENKKIINWNKKVYKLNNDRRVDMLNKFAKYNGLGENIEIKKAIVNGKRLFDIELIKGDIRRFVDKNKDFIDYITLKVKAKGGLSSAMISTNVDPHALYSYMGRGDGVGIYVNEGVCPNLPTDSRYTNLGGTPSSTPSDVNHGANVVGIVRGVSPLSNIYCRHGWSQFPDLSQSYSPNIFIESHSWYTGNTTNNYHTWDRDFDNHVWNTNISVFLIAGNEGLTHTNVTTPGKALNANTIGNYQDSTSGSESINDSSSFLDPETKNQKPEIVAPGTNITAGGVSNSTGTSMSTPHAAAFATDLMSNHTFQQLRPYVLKTALIAGSTKSIGGGADRVGVGGLDYYRAYYNNWTRHWVGSFDYWKNHDEGTNNYYLEKRNYFSSGRNVRAAISWLNRGDYTFDHRNEAHPIGKDFDMSVIDPNGNEVCYSWSYDNPYEMCEFTTTVSGYYTIQISRWSNSDSNAQMRLAATFNWE